MLLTGHTGFKGTWMSLMLEILGANVCGYSLPLIVSSFFSKAKVKVAEHCEGDIADRQKLENVIMKFKPEIIIHLASHSSLDGNSRIPDYILRTNIMGVVNLLDISRKLKSIKSILIVTSDKCYKNQEMEEPYVEECDLWGEDPYSVSKVCQELITYCYQKTFFEHEFFNEGKVGIATARASNVIGAGDYNTTRLIPYLLDCFKNEKIAILRNPKAVRTWQYVLDVIWGYLLLAQKLYENGGDIRYSGPYNFGSNMDGFREVHEIVEMVADCFPKAEYSFGEIKSSVRSETKILKLDSTKAHNYLNWNPIYTVEEMLRETTDFVIREKKGKDTGFLCRETVQSYLEKVKLSVK